METIKNYLEGMFAALPNTESVLKAKSELLQMMEDKYNELIEEGKSENEAVGSVISDFGNLNELAETLGLSNELNAAEATESTTPRRKLYLEEVKEYIDAKSTSAFRIALGVFLCIICVCGPIITESFNFPEWLGVSAMFIMVAAGVFLFVYNSTCMKAYDYIKNEPCQLDIMTVQYVDELKKNYLQIHAVRLTVGIVLCVISWIPCVIFDEFQSLRDLGGAFLFVLVGIGVFMIVYTNKIRATYDRLLNANDSTTVSGHYVSDEDVEYINDGVKIMMQLFWPTVTCIYLVWSFITFSWWKTWIIWPVAGIIHSVLKTNLRKDN